MIKTYEGEIAGKHKSRIVTVNGAPLMPRLDLREHSVQGFTWGYQGSGPKQLALAILADHLEDDEEALELYMPFLESVIAAIPSEKNWSLTSDDIEEALDEISSHQHRAASA